MEKHIDTIDIVGLNAKKFKHNLISSNHKLGEHILPLVLDEKAELDLIFIQGQQSHPLRTWSVSKEAP